MKTLTNTTMYRVSEEQWLSDGVRCSFLQARSKLSEIPGYAIRLYGSNDLLDI